jgi:hypothetical protein
MASREYLPISFAVFNGHIDDADKRARKAIVGWRQNGCRDWKKLKKKATES